MKLFAASLLSVLGLASAASAASIPAEVDLTAVRAIQTYNVDKTKPDHAYLIVTGIAGGKEVNLRLPEKDAWQVAPKDYPISSRTKPATLWSGQLDDGEFAALTVTVYQKNPDAQGDAAVNQFQEKVKAADKKVEALSHKTISDDEAKKLVGDLLNAHQEVVKGVKETLSREKKTDHYGGQFTILVRNSGGSLAKRLDPVGLTFGEHYGIKEKIYTKLKNTLSNVFTQDAGGDWAKESVPPLSDDEQTIRVKMLETEYVGSTANPTRNVTDYLLDVQVKGGNDALKWELGGETPGQSDYHIFWKFAQ